MNRKVDGVILLRTFVDDPQIEFLKNKNIPFITTGSTEEPGVYQVDHDHMNACKELTSFVLMKGFNRISILGGGEMIMANKKRLEGVMAAYEEAGCELQDENLYLNLESKAFVDRAVELAIGKNTDCILCMDDAICGQVLRKLRQENIQVPNDIRIASFYNSSVLENNIPSITSLSFDAKELGMYACKYLLNMIENIEVNERTLLSYEVVLKESTK